MATFIKFSELSSINIAQEGASFPLLQEGDNYQIALSALSNSLNIDNVSWDSAYNTVANLSSTWDYQGTDIKALTANWDSVYTTVQTNSAGWVDEGDKYLPLSGGNIVGDFTVDTDTLVVEVSSGNVGVGTATLSEKLTVDGTILSGPYKYNSTVYAIVTGTTFSLTDAYCGVFLICTNSSAVTIVVPSGLENNFYCSVYQKGTGQVSFDDDSGATTFLIPADYTATTYGQYDSIGIANVGDVDEYIVTGNLAPS